MDFKKIFIIAISLVTIAGTMAPVFIFAQHSTTTQEGKASCSKISDFSLKLTQDIAEREGKIESKRTEITDKIQQRWADQDSNLATKRAEWDKNRAEHIAKLKEKFPNDPQKQAVLNFEQAVNTALSVRRTAINSAISSFRQGVQQAKINRKTAMDAARATFKSSVNAATEKAKSDCASGVAIATIRQNFKKDILAAKEKYRSDYQAAEKLSASIDQLIQTRKVAIDKVIQDFKTAVEKVKIELQSAVGKNSGGTNASGTGSSQ